MLNIPNKRPRLETTVLAVVFLATGVGAIWWAFIIANVPDALYGVLAVLATILWVSGGVCLIRHALNKDGNLEIDSEAKQFVLNKTKYSFSDLNFYKSTLIAPRIGLATGYSSQHITLGVGKNVYKIADDIAAKHFNDEHVTAFNDLVRQSSLDVNQKESFSSWLERIQILSK